MSASRSLNGSERERIFQPGREVHRGITAISETVIVKTLSQDDISKADITDHRGLNADLMANVLSSRLVSMELNDGIMLVARISDRYAGYCRLEFDFKTSEYTGDFTYSNAELTFIYVAPEHREKGVGSILVDVALKVVEDEIKANGVHLFVKSPEGTDITARRLYLRKGFTDVPGDKCAMLRLNPTTPQGTVKHLHRTF